MRVPLRRPPESAGPSTFLRHRPKRRAVGSVLAALAVLGGCGDLFGPSEEDGLLPRRDLEVVPIELDSLWIQGIGVESEFTAGGVLIHAMGPETWDPTKGHLRGRATLTSTSGDAEDVLMGQSLCAEGDSAPFTCFNFLLHVTSPDVIPDLKARVLGLPGRWALPSICTFPPGTCELLSTADQRMTVWIFGNDLGTAMREAIEWPGVRLLELNWVALLWDPRSVPNRYQGGMPVAAGIPVPGNGVLEVQSGDTVTVEYLNPDGTLMRASREVVF